MSFRFLLAGGLSFAVDFAALYLLHGVAGVWLPLATATAFTVAFFVNFALNRTWVFQATGGAGRHLFRYTCLVAANLAVTVALVAALTALGTPYLIAKACCTGTLFIANYFVSKKWIYA